MKKHARKLVLNRETLHRLEILRNAVGGYTTDFRTNHTACSQCCNEGTYGECLKTYEDCSLAYCETGGACSSSCVC